MTNDPSIRLIGMVLVAATVLVGCGDDDQMVITDSDAMLHCGNGVVNDSEECDGNDLQGQTCADVYPPDGTGELGCTQGCALDDTGCVGCGDGLCDAARGETASNCLDDCEGVLPDPPHCPDPVSDDICINGWAKYFLDPASPTTMMQTLVTMPSEPIEVRVYDPMAYAINPTTPPLAISAVDDVTGTFRVTDVMVPATSFVALAVVNAEQASTETFVMTMAPYQAIHGFNLTRVDAYAITTQQNDNWSATVGDTWLQGAGCDPGSTMLSCGTWIGVFGYWLAGALVKIPGVVPQNGSEPPPPIQYSKVVYLDDSYGGFVAPASAAQSYTTTTGTVFSVRATLGNYSGECADLEPDGICEQEAMTWDRELSGAMPNAFSVQLMIPYDYD